MRYSDGLRIWIGIVLLLSMFLLTLAIGVFVGGHPLLRTQCAAKGVRAYAISPLGGTALQLRDDPTCKEAP